MRNNGISHKSRRIAVGVAMILVRLLVHPTATASETTQDGHAWLPLSKANKTAYCTMYIHFMIGTSSYTPKTIELAAWYYAGRLDYFYKTHPLNTTIRDALDWAWPDVDEYMSPATDEYM